MNPESSKEPPESSSIGESPGIPWTSVSLFFVSGSLALVYEVCWIRKASVVFGSANYALSIVLAVFFGGMALGSYFGGRLFNRVQHPIRVYGLLELGIGIYAFLSPSLFDAADGLYTFLYPSAYRSFFVLTLIRAILVSLILLPPTFAMGATLPVFCRALIHREDAIRKSISWLYAINTAGAAVGAAFTGFYAIPHLGIFQTIYLAGALNLVLGAIALTLKFPPIGDLSPKPRPGPAPATLPFSGKLIAVLFLLTGFAAVGNEVLWSRFLSLIIHNRVYSYTLVITIVLAGIVIGSILSSFLRIRDSRLPLLFGILQCSLALNVLIVLMQPPERWAQFLDTENVRAQAQLVGLILLVPSVLSGASFPVGIKLVTHRARDTARRAGLMTALNTLGGILGALITGFFLITHAGMQTSLLILTGTSMLTGCSALLLLDTGIHKLKSIFTGAAFLGLWVAWILSSSTRLPADYLAGDKKLIESREGITSFVTVLEEDGDCHLEVDRLWQGTNRKGQQVVAAHVPMLLHPDPKEVLVIGLGSGQAAGRFLMHDPDRLLVVEIEAAMVPIVEQYFDSSWLADPRVEILIEDGRNFISHSQDRFDVISIEVGQVFRPGVVSFYTEDFYEAAAQRLKPGGILCQFLPISFFELPQLEALLSSFLETFPNAALWYNTSELLLLGSPSSGPPIELRPGRLSAITENAALREDLNFSIWGGTQFYLNIPETFIGGYLTGPEGLRALAGSAPTLRDNRPWLEYASVETEKPVVQTIARIREHLADFSSLMPGQPAAGTSFRRAEIVRDLNLNNILAVSLRSNLNYALRENDLSGAITVLNQMQQLNPFNIHMLHQLANALGLTGQTEPAIRLYRKILEEEPGLAAAHLDLGRVLASAGDFENAKVHFRKSFDLGDRSVWTYLNLAQVELSERNLQKARDLIERATIEFPGQAIVWRRLGDFHSQLGNSSEAGSAYETALSLALQSGDQEQAADLRQLIDQLGRTRP